MNKNNLNYVSLFSSAGVGCYGFAIEDFNCVASNEIIERRLNIQKSNNKCKYDSGYISGDITLEATKNRIFQEISLWKNNEGIKEIDVLIATPPCQGMSVANHKKNNELDRNSLIVESIKLTKEIFPKIFIFENVRALLKTDCIDLDGKEKSIEEAIELNLGGKYNILSKIINFKDYGVPSSRTRTLVIGVRKNIKDISPYDLMPKIESQRTIRETIEDLPELKNMGEISQTDILHNFRKYDLRMLDWIKNLNEGQSAFDNKNPKKRPHRIINGNIIYNQNKNGDKYRKCKWDQIAPCVHTRNDTLASQSTIHPRDNRVFSIRELMRFMSIPQEFKWTPNDLDLLNNLSIKEKENYLRENELNIRQSIGEAVPTLIFRKIAKNIKQFLYQKKYTNNEIYSLIEKEKLNQIKNLLKYIRSNNQQSFSELSRISELANSRRLDTSAYYTCQNIIYPIIKDLPDFKDKKEIKILEPSGGCGNFIPQLIEKYKNCNHVVIDIVDIDTETIETLKILIKRLEIPQNIEINLINDDFLLHKFDYKYNLVIGNPPFKKIINNKYLISRYKQGAYNSKTNNIFSFFIEKAISLGDVVALITPKSLLSTPELALTRELMQNKNVSKIIDYGEFGFDVKIETISFILGLNNSNVKIESYITNEVNLIPKEYLFGSDHPYWIIYRNEFFDKIANGMNLGVFSVYRDRQITKKITQANGRFRVLRSRNLNIEGNIIDIEGYDMYLDELKNISISKFINQKAFIAPNLSYNPRAGILPKDSIVDGSLAILVPKSSVEVSKENLDYFSSEEFKKFYRIVCNHGTRSLNINSNTVHFWGIKNDN